MRVTYAQFNIEHGGKSYAVQMGVQVTYRNSTSVHVTVIATRDDGSKRVILTRSVQGRQIVSPFNAKKYLREALVAEGIVKERQKKEYEPTEKQIQQLGNALDERAIELMEKMPTLDLKTTGGPVNDNRPTPGLMKKIKGFFK
jgi:hypothetical protein